MRCNDRLARRRSIVAAAAGGAVLGAFGRRVQASGGISSDDIHIAIDGGAIDGFRAAPARSGKFPCLVIIGDADRPAVCRRLAEAGYLAISADVLVGDANDDAVLRRVDRTFELARQDAGDAARAALIGFGRGGRVTWLFAAQRSSLKAAVAWGGALDAASPMDKVKTPLTLAAELKAPLLGLFGTDDTSNSRTVLLQAESASRGRAELVSYVGVGADFAIEGRPGYDKAAALDGWQRMLGWLKHHGVV